MNKKRLLKYPVLAAVATLAATILLPPGERQVPSLRDYPGIAGEGIIRVTTEYNSIGFFVDGDTLAGFHYELIEAFARQHRLRTDITPKMSFAKRMQGLAAGQFDVAACDIPATSELKDSFLLTHPVALDKEVLVQRKPRTPRDSALFVRSQLELAGKTLHVVKDASSMLRIRNLSREIADTIRIEETERYGPEQLIALVAHGDIDYAVCNESIARAIADSLPQVDISTDISFTQFCSWVVNRRSPALRDSLNAWLDAFKKTPAYRKLYRKYHRHDPLTVCTPSSPSSPFLPLPARFRPLPQVAGNAFGGVENTF